MKGLLDWPHFYAFMRTTLDIPDAVFKRTKLRAVHEGIAFKMVVVRALDRELAAPAQAMLLRKKRAQRLFAALDKTGNKAALRRLKREDLYDRPVLRSH